MRQGAQSSHSSSSVPLVTTGLHATAPPRDMIHSIEVCAHANPLNWSMIRVAKASGNEPPLRSDGMINFLRDHDPSGQSRR